MLPSGGFKYQRDSAKACNARISNVTLTNAGATEVIVDAAGNVLNPAKPFCVAVNNFMADGGDGYATFRKRTHRLGGPQDIDALTAYMAQFKAPRAAYDPAANAAEALRASFDWAAGLSALPAPMPTRDGATLKRTCRRACPTELCQQCGGETSQVMLASPYRLLMSAADHQHRGMLPCRGRLWPYLPICHP